MKILLGLEGLICGVEHPVWFQPIEHIVVAGDQNGFLAGASPGFGESASANLRNLAVYYRCELVEYNLVWLLGKNAGKVSAELLAGA